jgi:hypothetical protein
MRAKILTGWWKLVLSRQEMVLEAPTGATLPKGAVSKYLYRPHLTIGITGAMQEAEGSIPDMRQLTELSHPQPQNMRHDETLGSGLYYLIFSINLSPWQERPAGEGLHHLRQNKLSKPAPVKT